MKYQALTRRHLQLLQESIQVPPSHLRTITRITGIPDQNWFTLHRGQFWDPRWRSAFVGLYDSGTVYLAPDATKTTILHEIGHHWAERYGLERSRRMWYAFRAARALRKKELHRLGLPSTSLTNRYEFIADIYVVLTSARRRTKLRLFSFLFRYGVDFPNYFGFKI